MVSCSYNDAVPVVSVKIPSLAARSVVDRAWGGRDKLTNADKVKTSTIAGGFAGMIGGLLRK